MSMSADGTLAKGLSVFETLVEYPDGLGVTKLAHEVGLPVSTVHRLLAEMVRLGFVQLDVDNRRYRLGMKLFELGYRASRLRSLSDVARPIMKRLAELTESTIFMGVREGRSYFFVERVGGAHRVQIRGSIGERMPLHATSGGKCLLAYLPQNEQEMIISELKLEKVTTSTITDKAELLAELERVKEFGYAITNAEVQEEICSISVPIMATDGTPAYALTIATPAFLVPPEDLKRFLPSLREAGREIELQLPRGDDLDGHAL